MKKIIFALLLLGFNQMAGAAINFVFVPSDDALRVAGTTRDAYNIKNPESGKKWREAWKTKGSKKDNAELQGIRKSTTEPKD